MKPILKPIAIAVALACAPLSLPTYAQAVKTSTKPVTPSTAATAAPSEDWIVYDDTTFTPVADSVSLHLEAARKAFDAKDNPTAVAEMRAAADELEDQATNAAKTEKELAKSELKQARDTYRHMHKVAGKVRSAATDIENGKIKTKADLNRVLDKAARADLDRRWLVSDVTVWYPATEGPQRHFSSAAEAYNKKDYKTAATEIRKASAYLRLEAARVDGDARQALDHSVTELERLATSIEKNTVKNAQRMEKTFADADHALALAHRRKAAESWARKEYNKAGYELKAAAHGLENGARWVGKETQAGTSAVVAGTRELGDKLASGANWTRDEVAKGFESLGNAINTLGHEIGSNKKAAPVHVGT